MKSTKVKYAVSLIDLSNEDSMLETEIVEAESWQNALDIAFPYYGNILKLNFDDEKFNLFNSKLYAMDVLEFIFNVTKII